METFIYPEVNRSCRDKDQQQIEYYGAFAAALSYIIYFANQTRKDKISGLINLYRGLKLDLNEIEMYQVESNVNLTGYTSSTTNPNVAIEFALDNPQQNLLPVVFHIEFVSQVGLFQMSKEYTAYPDEDEILIQDGLQYRVKSVTKLKTEEN